MKHKEGWVFKTTRVVGTLALVFGIPMALAACDSNQQTPQQRFFDKVIRSIKEGKAMEDIREILESRFADKGGKLTLGEAIKDKDEDWMDSVSKKHELHVIPEMNNTAVAFFDVTHNCDVVELPITELDGATPIGGSASENIEYYDLKKAMEGNDLMMLSMPSYEYSQEDTEYNESLKNNPETIRDVSLKYLMYASFRDKSGQMDTSASMQSSRSGKRGGIILNGDNELIVAAPQEFKLLSDGGDNLAEMEYAFTIDSTTLEDDIQTIKDSSTLKDLSMAGYTNFLTTFYDKDGGVHTVQVSVLSLFDKQSNTFGPKGEELNVYEMASLAQQYATEHDYRRFVIAVPDNKFGLLAPFHRPFRATDKEMMWTSNEYAYLQMNNDNSELYRRLDAIGRNFYYPTAPFHYLIVAKAAK